MPDAEVPVLTRPLAIGIYLAVLAIAAGTALVGVPIWIALAVAATPWLLLLMDRWGGILGFAATIVAAASVLLLALIASSLVGVRIDVVTVIVAVAAGAGGALAVRALGARPPAASAVIPVLPALLGGAVWAAVVGAAQFIPGAAHYSWAMNGDAANNVLFARVVLYNDGVALGMGENPVPLPPALVAVVMSAGRDGVPSSELTQHDVSALLFVWAGLIALLCTLAGLVGQATMRADRRVLRAIVAAGASLLPISWFVVGYPLEFGFLNTHVILCVILLGWLIYLRSERRPAVGLGLLALSGTLALASWGPLVLFPAMLGLAVIVRGFHGIRRAPRSELILMAVGILVFLGYALAATLPSFLYQSNFAAVPGGAFPFSRWMLPALGVGVVVLGVANLLLRGRSGSSWWCLLGVFGLVAATAAGWGALLFAARTTPDPWISYYPVKYAWLAAVALLLVGVGGAAGLVSLIRPRLLRAAGIVALAVASVAALAVLPFTRTGYAQENPALRVLRGDFWAGGDTYAYEIFDNADREAPVLVWDIGDDNSERLVNFWVLQIQSNWTAENIDLNIAAYSVLVGDADTPEELCDIIELMGAPTTVRTADPALEGDLQESCPAADWTVELVD